MTRELQIGAKVPVSRTAEGAAAAGDGRIEHDPFAATRAARDRTRKLVTEDQRSVENRVADATLEKPVTIGTAETDGADAYEDLPRLRLRVRLLVQLQLTRRVEAERFHPG